MATKPESLKAVDVSGGRRPGLTTDVVGHLLQCTTTRRFEFVNLTQLVEELIGQSGICDGIAFLQSLHSTAAVFVNEWQDALLDDLRTMLEQMVRADAAWRHNDPLYSDCDRSNAASHLRAALLGTSATLAVRDGQLVRGKWQSIILGELDGPRTCSVSLQVLGTRPRGARRLKLATVLEPYGQHSGKAGGANQENFLALVRHQTRDIAAEKDRPRVGQNLRADQMSKPRTWLNRGFPSSPRGRGRAGSPRKAMPR